MNNLRKPRKENNRYDLFLKPADFSHICGCYFFYIIIFKSKDFIASISIYEYALVTKSIQILLACLCLGILPVPHMCSVPV